MIGEIVVVCILISEGYCFNGVVMCIKISESCVFCMLFIFISELCFISPPSFTFPNLLFSCRIHSYLTIYRWLTFLLRIFRYQKSLFILMNEKKNNIHLYISLVLIQVYRISSWWLFMYTGSLSTKYRYIHNIELFSRLYTFQQYQYSLMTLTISSLLNELYQNPEILVIIQWEQTTTVLLLSMLVSFLSSSYSRWNKYQVDRRTWTKHRCQ